MEEYIDQIVRPVSDGISDVVFYEISIGAARAPIVVIWLFVAAIFFTFYFRFLNITGLRHAIRLVSGRADEQDTDGEVSHFKALMTALSGTVGIGNIGGMAIVISLGGPGAIFWMVVAGFLSMTTKFVECTLGVKYRQIEADDMVSGGPMYYLSRGLSDHGWPKLGRSMGAFYAMAMVIGSLGIGNMFQSNQAYEQFVVLTGGEQSYFADKSWLFGAVIAILVAIVVFGGLRRIANVAFRLVPFMAVSYLALAILVIILNADRLPWALSAIVTAAFTAQGVGGGVIGIMVWGIKRAVFSNEAGMGSAAIAHATVRTDQPISEGYVALLEPLIDTVVICLITSLVILTTVYDPEVATFEVQGIALTSQAFESTFSWSVWPISICAILFAFSTIISWSYYGAKGWTYLVGEGPRRRMIMNSVFSLFVALGCVVDLDAILDFSDAIVFLVVFPNILGLYIMAPTIKREWREYGS